MKTFLAYFLIVSTLVGLVGCTPKNNNTIADLKAAIDGETTASTKYTAYAQQAAKDSLFAVEALFKATAQAEAIHAARHRKVLAILGVTDYLPEISAFVVKNTAENLKSAADGEQYEFTEMYPVFILDAEYEKVPDAVESFNLAQDAEKKHSEIYTQVAALLASSGEIAQVYYVCQKCGYVYPGTPPASCELCQTPSSAFVAFPVVAPVAQTLAETPLD